MHADPTDIIAADLTLTGVQPGAHLDAQCLHSVADRHGTADRALRTVESREEAVSRCVHLTAAKPSKLPADDGVMRIKQRMPVTATPAGCPARRVHGVGDQR